MKHRSIRVATTGVAIAALTTGLLAGCSSADSGGGEGGEQTLRVTLANHVWTDIVKDKISEFEEAHEGVTVEVTQLGEDQLSDQYNVKLNAGTDEIDVMMYRPLQEGKLFAQNGYLADLSDYVTQDAEWDWDDFQSGPVEATTFDGAVVGVPIITEQEVLYYRTDVLESLGIAVPSTLEELEAASKQIKEQGQIAGFVARTGVSAAVTQFSSFLFSEGGDFANKDYTKATIDSDEAKAAYELYGRLIGQYGPDNVSTDMSWPDAAALFAQGQVAFYTDASSLYQNLALEENSTVWDKVGYAPFPSGKAGSVPYNVPSWALGINNDSSKKDLSFEFVKWLTSPEMTLEVQTAGVPAARASVWSDPQGTASFPEQLAEAISIGSETGFGYDRPLVINVAEAREIVGAPIVEAITGGDVDAAIAKAQADFQAFLDDENS
ncbi:sugar ABC transporter substrate-binding protein [Microbacterium pseudoresistens]|uniref:Multiple sugar transport system substrate-binding protein n=1 Tax=Microbacterium pseudoresistens TaxID=640634 RepID=A0A7Y9ESG7_9MICO|nr:multiple sugar transport system substrate-binding protein [Microbacterium pseudoresistens]